MMRENTYYNCRIHYKIYCADRFKITCLIIDACTYLHWIELDCKLNILFVKKKGFFFKL